MAARTLRPLLLILGSAVVITVLQVGGVLEPLTGPLVRGLAPVLGAINRAGAATYQFVTFATPGRLARENTELRAQVMVLTQENSTLATRALEAEALSELDRALKPLKLPTIVARVLARTADPSSSILTLDRGTEDGLVEGDAVLSSDGFLLGRVVSVSRSTSQMLPLTDSRSRIAVRVQTGVNPLGLVEGDRGLRLILTNVKRDPPIAPGQGVVTAGVDPGIPSGIPVASIEAVSTKPSDLFQSATLSLGQPDAILGPVAVVTLPR